MNLPLIEDWSIVKRTANPYQAPELGVTCLQGYVYNDMRAGDGEAISTSVIRNIDLKSSTAQTRNTKYELGTICDKFESYMKDNGYTINQYVETINSNTQEAE